MASEATPKGPYRIWYQSAVDITEHSYYLKHLQQYLNSIADPGFVFEVHGINADWRRGVALSELNLTNQVVKNAARAEADGYAGFVVGHYPEGGHHEAKCTVDIPVLGLAETSLLYACTLGQRIGLVAIGSGQLAWHPAQIAKYGLRDRVVTVQAATEMALTEILIHPENYPAFRAEFFQQSEKLVEQGVEVIVPAGGVAMLLLSREPHLRVGKGLILNGVPVVAKMTELAIKLRNHNQTTTSRVGWYTKATDFAISELLASE